MATRTPLRRGLKIGSQDKELETARLLRQRIATHVFEPGTRLPTRRELVSMLGVSLITVQRAMENLEREGFIVSRGAAGSYVSDHPPHLSRFAVLFTAHPAAGSEAQVPWSNFNWAIKIAAEGIEQAQEKRNLGFTFSYGLFPRLSSDSPTLKHLLDDLHEHRLAGLILTMPHILDQPELLQKDVPAVLLTVRPMHGIPCVYPDHADFLRKAVAHLVQRGRRRIAILDTYNPDAGIPLEQACRGYGLPLRPTWARAVPPQEARQCARELVQLPRDQRPDGLILADDHLLHEASVGLLLGNAQVGEAMDVVAHANFPRPVRAFVPATYIGFDARQIVQLCIQRICEQRQGNRAPEMTLVPAIQEPGP